MIIGIDDGLRYEYLVPDGNHGLHIEDLGGLRIDVEPAQQGEGMCLEGIADDEHVIASQEHGHDVVDTRTHWLVSIGLVCCIRYFHVTVNHF